MILLSFQSSEKFINNLFKPQKVIHFDDFSHYVLFFFSLATINMVFSEHNKTLMKDATI